MGARLTDQYVVARWSADDLETGGGRLNGEALVIEIQGENGDEPRVAGLETPSGDLSTPDCGRDC